MMPGRIIAFEKPGTGDFVYDPFFTIGGFPVNWIVVMALVTVLAVIAVFYFGLRKGNTVPGRLQLMCESGVQFIRETVVMEVIGPQGLVFLPLLVSLFVFIFFANIFEVMPGNTTINSRVAFPLVMGFTIWVLYNAVGIKRHGVLRYLKNQCVPPGSPKFMLVLLVPVEFLSNIVVRPFSLALRLFLNMMAGHFLLALVFGATILTWEAAIWLKPFAVLPLAISVGMLLVEIFVAILQAFIFVILSATYLQSAMAAEH